MLLLPLVLVSALSLYGLPACANSNPYTYTLIQSPASCPTPIPPQPVKIEVPTSFSSHYVIVTAGEYGELSPQFAIQTYEFGDYFRFLADNSSSVTVFFPTNSSAYIDNTGIRLFTADCSKELLLPVPNLIHILNRDRTPTSTSKSAQTGRGEQANTTSKPTQTLAHRVNLTVSFENQCYSPIPGQNAYLNCSYFNNNYETGNPPFSKPIGRFNLTELGSTANYTGYCTDEEIQPQVLARCEKSISPIATYASTGFLGQLNNITNITYFQNAMTALYQVIANGTVPATIQPRASMFPIQEAANSTTALYYFATIFRPGSIHLNSICREYFQFNLEASVTTNISGKGMESYIFYTGPLGKSTGYGTARFALPSPTCRPYCAQSQGSWCGLPEFCTDNCFCQAIQVDCDRLVSFRDSGAPCSNFKKCQNDSDCTGHQLCVSAASNCCNHTICLQPKSGSKRC